MIDTQMTNIKDCIVFCPNLYQDSRGIFTEVYKTSMSPIDFQIKQTNCSVSKAGVLRGIHRTPYAKLVTCVKGSVYDVCVDLRPDSPTYQDYYGILLNSDNMCSLYIPPYCGHGFLALEESVLVYHQDQEYNKTLDETYCYKQYKISWPKEPLIVSEKDLGACHITERETVLI